MAKEHVTANLSMGKRHLSSAPYAQPAVAVAWDFFYDGILMGAGMFDESL